MKYFAFRQRPCVAQPASEMHLFQRISHPILSVSELESLAQRIAKVDGVSPLEARHQIMNFRASSLVRMGSAITSLFCPVPRRIRGNVVAEDSPLGSPI